MTPETDDVENHPGRWGLVVIAWALVATPLAWGVLMTFRKAMLLFNH